MNSSMPRLAKLILWIGVILTVFGIIGALLVKSFVHPLMVLHMFLGGTLMIIGFVSSKGKSVGVSSRVRRGRAGDSIGVAAYALVFASIILVFNLYAIRFDKRWDFTEAGVYSLAPQSIQVVRGVSEPLEIIAVKTSQKEANLRQIKDRLDLYKFHNPTHVQTEIIDARARPDLVKELGLQGGETMVVSLGSEREKIAKLPDASEQSITEAILRLSQGVKPKIYFLAGNGGPSILDSGNEGLLKLGEELEKEGVRVGTIDKEPLFAVPEDAAAIAVVAPEEELSEKTISSLLSFSKRGGHLFLMHEPSGSNSVSILAKQFGVEIGADVVIDQMQRTVGSPEIGWQIVSRDFGKHPIVRTLSGGALAIFLLSSSVRGPEDNSSGRYTEFLHTGPTSWAEQDLKELLRAADPTAELDEGETKGPLSLAVAVEPFNKQGGRVIVVGDSTWALNANVDLFSNRDLVLNSVNWLLGREGNITIRPGVLRASFAPIQSGEFNKILAGSFLVPEFILLLGIFVWWRRRYVASR